MDQTKQLIYIPILHTEADMGSLASGMKKTYISRFGKTKYSSHARAIDEMWNGMKKRLVALKFNLSKTKIYQDGLTNCGIEQKIVQDLAKRGSLNHLLVMWLIEQGSTLVGTEDPDLLIQ